ncbi:MAG: type II toxin-antitoxin system mRNA interferase toxin, RelE/StbE family [Syntrophus sp. (in: bacteria)]|nr:type II toxin-antitoxin system mRNA interferase toxin, RelE/StbE family [Syntrophus sp. (in: bacteria)]
MERNRNLKDLYTLRFLGRALQDLKKIDLPFQKIIKEKLLILAENPDILKNNIIKLAGTKEHYYRLRVGSHRIIYEKKDKELIILIIRIGHRREIYQ